jgi:TRAP-type C4-dicarboxylate transport system permease small subunit
MSSHIISYLDDNFEKILCSSFLALLVFCLGLQVLMRYVFKSGLTWAEELSRFAFIWTIYLGIAMAAKQEQHLRVTAQYYIIPKALRHYMWLAADLIWVIFNVLFTVQGIGLVMHALEFPETTPSLGWSAAYIYTIIPIGFLLMTFRILQLYYRGFKNRNWRKLVRIEGMEQ